MSELPSWFVELSILEGDVERYFAYRTVAATSEDEAIALTRAYFQDNLGYRPEQLGRFQVQPAEEIRPETILRMQGAPRLPGLENY